MKNQPKRKVSTVESPLLKRLKDYDPVPRTQIQRKMDFYMSIEFIFKKF